ncbi:hypothetical protein [Afipia felis]|uniref:Uncharacterized protein n=2 Tax=Afipia felis TaxID=1035 RepID=A0A380WAZ9_AFIFE|nr:hypothetical protein [Afipia felis]EKS29381.1 hypothetical protein HMPREF9697_01909 [Afipia felis ATCC 53690]SUU78089.1 Uncharacterised protein [Afipia felis]SUU86154.1 Uncharacterised protein [Afipia felis]
MDGRQPNRWSLRALPRGSMPSMDGVDNSGEWMEALRLEAEGDPSLLEALFINNAPLHLQEAVRRALRKGLKPVTGRTKNLTDAVVWYIDNGGDIGRAPRPNATLLHEASRRYGLKTGNGCSVLWNAIKAKDAAVNAELRRRGYKAV